MALMLKALSLYMQSMRYEITNQSGSAHRFCRGAQRPLGTQIPSRITAILSTQLCFCQFWPPWRAGGFDSADSAAGHSISKGTASRLFLYIRVFICVMNTWHSWNGRTCARGLPVPKIRLRTQMSLSRPFGGIFSKSSCFPTLFTPMAPSAPGAVWVSVWAMCLYTGFRAALPAYRAAPFALQPEADPMAWAVCAVFHSARKNDP